MPWLHCSIGWWIEGRQADFEACNKLACRHPWARDLNPSNVVATPSGLKIIDFEVVDSSPDSLRSNGARHVWDFILIVRLPGGGESRDIWKLGPYCIKRWSRQVSPADVRLRCRVSRDVPVRNRMRYVPWLHWTVARWIVGEPATHEACNRLLARFPGLRDLHPGNVVAVPAGPVVIDSSLSLRFGSGGRRALIVRGTTVTASHATREPCGGSKNSRRESRWNPAGFFAPHFP